MKTKRIIENAIGHRIALEMLEEADGIRLSREDCSKSDQIILDMIGAKILSAYLASAMVTRMAGRPAEEVNDDSRTIISVMESPAPMVRIVQGVKTFDIHSPSWDPLRCEIELILPRLMMKTHHQNDGLKH
jgi:hypothetical protein